VIGIIGGTFDPVHFGHLRPALEICEQLSMDELRFIPSAKPPHRWQPEASAEHRLAMVKLAVEDVENLVVDDREYHRKGSSYTVDTLASIREEIGETEPLSMMIGMDAFEYFTQWHDWQEIMALAHLVISPRPGYFKGAVQNWMKGRIAKSIEELHDSVAGKIFYADVNQFEISATYIRKQILEGKSSYYTTPLEVAEYIQQHKLYESPV